MINWLAILLGSTISVVLLWCFALPLGISGEWVWQRTGIEPDAAWNLLGGAIAASLYIGYVVFCRSRFEQPASSTKRTWEITASLLGLVVLAFGWLWSVQEISPVESRLGKAAFVLYYPSSSGYFTRARYDQPNASELLATYEGLMGQGDVLHTGTHPPGLFLVFHGLIAFCSEHPVISSLMDSTQPLSFLEACDVIAKNSLRLRKPTVVLPLDRQVIWLATLLVMWSASLTIIPLFLLLRRTCTLPVAWTGAALWPAMPAVAIFVPKSDVVFPLIAVTVLWLWITAWDRRSLLIGMLSGLIAWCGLICSLAFLPVFLATGLLTLGTDLARKWFDTKVDSGGNVVNERTAAIGIRHWLCIAAAGFGFAIPTIALGCFAHVNLLNVWWMNYRNHANFYHEYSRTYWKWLLLNPIELSFSAGWPIAMMALIACCHVIRRAKSRSGTTPSASSISIVSTIVFVWGLLWLTGKNSGEAARLWIIFLPWLIWLTGIELSEHESVVSDSRLRQRQILVLLIAQFIVCMLTVTRVSGFHFDGG